MSRTVVFSGLAPLNVGGGQPPRGMAVVETVKAIFKLSDGKQTPMDQLTCKVTAYYAFDEATRTYKVDNTWKGYEFKNMTLMHPQEKFADGNRDRNDKNARQFINDKREQELKTAILSHNMSNREALAAMEGVLDLPEVEAFIGKTGHILFDPTPEGISGNDNGPERWFVAPDQFQAIIKCERPSNWPWDKKKARILSKAAGGAALGGAAAGGTPWGGAGAAATGTAALVPPANAGAASQTWGGSVPTNGAGAAVANPNPVAGANPAAATGVPSPWG